MTKALRRKMASLQRYAASLTKAERQKVGDLVAVAFAFMGFLAGFKNGNIRDIHDIDGLFLWGLITIISTLVVWAELRLFVWVGLRVNPPPPEDPKPEDGIPLDELLPWLVKKPSRFGRKPGGYPGGSPVGTSDASGFCITCGLELKTDARYCSTCGTARVQRRSRFRARHRRQPGGYRPPPK